MLRYEIGISFEFLIMAVGARNETLYRKLKSNVSLTENGNKGRSRKEKLLLVGKAIMRVIGLLW